MQNTLNKLSKKRQLNQTNNTDLVRKRRTRSHKRYKVMKNKHKKSKLESRHSRRKFNVMKLHHLPSMESLKNGKVWLSTHKWHTKRFHMRSLWGYSLPHRSTSYGLRHVSRILKNSCAVHDRSYLQPVKLQGPLEELLSLLEHYTVISRSLSAFPLTPLRILSLIGLILYF
jgi:ribonuclease P/MRP protein subunit POP1